MAAAESSHFVKNERQEPPSAEFSSQHLAVTEASSPSPCRTIFENPPFKTTLEPFGYVLPCTLTSLVPSFIRSTHIY